jgi:acetylornithine deacetylase/succinyl-diaminopimelate desuccinylase-like protein
MTDSTREMCQQHAASTKELLEEVWTAIDAGEEYEGSDAQEYLDEWPLEVVWEKGEEFAVVLGTGGPHIEITGGGRNGGYKLAVYWAGEQAFQSGEAITRTGEYFREMVEVD